MLTFDIRGEKAIAAKLRQFNRADIAHALNVAGTDPVMKNLRLYPRQRPGSKYKRRGAAGGLQSGWAYRKATSGNLAYEAYNTIDYASEVVGVNQRPIMRGVGPYRAADLKGMTGWLTVGEIFEAVKPRMLEVFEAELVKRLEV
jgi:hypothetical protein